MKRKKERTIKGSCDGHKVQEETKGEEHGTGRRGVID
jgi:hypothetical protein